MAQATNRHLTSRHHVMLTQLAPWIGTASLFAALVLWLEAFVQMFRAVRNKKDGAPEFPGWQHSPYILTRPEQLTETGLVARRRSILCLIGFLPCLVIGFGIIFLFDV